ncbi:MAG: ribbon-helix-helix protein, CopG family [Candidatus Binatia bacterium]
MDDDLIEAVDEVRAKEHRDRSAVVHEALRLWLGRRRLAEQVRCHGAGYKEHPVSDDEFQPASGTQQWPR